MPAGSQRKMRLRARGRGGGGGAGGGGASWTSGRGSRTVTTSAALALASGVVRDLSDPDGLLRPLLRSVATRLAESRRPGIDRVGERYLRLDPPLPGTRAGDMVSPMPTVLSRDAGTGERAGTLDEQGASADVVEGEVIEEGDEEPPEQAAARGDAAAPACLSQPQPV